MKFSILVVDDERNIRTGLGKALELDGYRVSLASDGQEALEMMSREEFDLIITDLIMPNKDGIGMIIDLKKEFPEVKIIAMSGGGLNRPEGYLRGAHKLGAAYTLSKPLNRNDLLRAVRDTLKGASAGTPSG